jgi:hypothetical protein
MPRASPSKTDISQFETDISQFETDISQFVVARQPAHIKPATLLGRSDSQPPTISTPYKTYGDCCRELVVILGRSDSEGEQCAVRSRRQDLMQLAHPPLRHQPPTMSTHTVQNVC